MAKARTNTDWMLADQVDDGGKAAFIQNVKLVDSSGSGGGAVTMAAIGSIAHDAAGAAINPLLIGGYSSTSIPTAVSTNTDAVRAWLTNRGGVVVSGGPAYAMASVDGSANNLGALHDSSGNISILAMQNFLWSGSASIAQRGDANGAVVQSGLSSTFWNYAAASGGIVSSTADVAIKAAGAASVRNYLKSLQIAHDTLSATTEIVVKDGASVIWRGLLFTTASDPQTIVFDPPLKGTAATALNAALITSVTGGVYVNAQGFTGS